MGFLQIKRDTIYLNVTNNPILIRPLFPETEGRWVHNIPSCSRVTPQGKKENIRFYRQVDANFSSWMKDNPDPLWDLLDPQDKFDRDGNRQDFSVRPIHLLPVWVYELNDVKIAKFGNQFFEEMVKWYDQGNKVTDSDWMAWTEGNGRRVQYKTSRQDATAFNFQGDMNALSVKCQELMKKAIDDLVQFKTEEDMIKFISGETQQESTSFNFGANQQPPQAQMPSYTPGGQAVTTHGAMPASLPPANPMPQMAVPSNSLFGASTTQAPVQPPIPTTQAPVQPPAGNMFGYNPQAPVGYTPSPPQNFAPQPPAQPSPPQNLAPQPPAQPPAQPSPLQNFAPQPPAQPMVPGVSIPGVSSINQSEVPNAPVNGQPVFAPPVQAQVPMPQMPAQANQSVVPTTPPVSNTAPAAGNNPADVVIDFGKYSGKTLGWVHENDRGYLTFLKGNKKEQYAHHIEALLSGFGSTQTQPAIPTTIQQPTQQSSDEAQRQQILEQINQKFLNIPDFQGPGIAHNMMPFLTSTIGTTDFSTAPLADLVKLNVALDQRIAQG